MLLVTEYTVTGQTFLCNALLKRKMNFAPLATRHSNGLGEGKKTHLLLLLA